MYAVIYIPNFSLQAALRLELELNSRPVALIDAQEKSPLVIAINQTARQQGIVIGLTPSQAMARCANLNIKSRSASQETSATEILLETAYAFSPNIEATAPGTCTLELTGLDLDSEELAQKWAEKIRQQLAQLGLKSQIGFASTPMLALLAANIAKNGCIHATSMNFVLPLPIEILKPAEKIQEILPIWGIHSVGEFLALGRENIAERLGTDGLELFDRVSLDAVRPLKLVVPKEDYTERMDFEYEIETTEPLLFILHRFVEQLTMRVQAGHGAISELELSLKLASAEIYRQHFKIPRPTDRIETLFRMLQTHLETLRTDSSIVGITLRAAATRVNSQQLRFFEITLSNPHQFDETMARLTALCGNDRVGSPVLEGTHRPDAFKMVAPNFSATENLAVSSPVPSGLQLRRFRPPLPTAMRFWKEQPISVEHTMFKGVINQWRGPFVSSGDWWDNHSWTRKEWDIETINGNLLRIFQSGEGFFIEGVYD